MPSLGWLLNLDFAGGQASLEPPYVIAAMQIPKTGMVAGQMYQGGVQAGQISKTGIVTGQIV